MTQKTTNTSPFGLSIAVGIAMKKLKEGDAPPSIVLANLFSIQKSTTFPKALDEQFFANTQYRTNDAEKKVILAMLEEMKKPNVDVKKMLTDFFTPIWVKKIALPNKPNTSFSMGKVSVNGNSVYKSRNNSR